MERITSQMTARLTLNDINQALDRLNVTQEELSSGKRINEPSDDPYGAGLAVQLNSTLAEFSQYSSNISDGEAWATTADSALTSINGLAQRARELLVGAANGTNDAADLQAIAAELTQEAGAITQAANANYDGQYVFSGGRSAPYSTVANQPGFTGAFRPVTREVGPGGAIAPVSFDISGALGTQGGATGILHILTQAAADLTAGNSANIGGYIQQLDTSLGALSADQAQVGASEDSLQLAATRIQSLQDNTTAQLSSTEDVDFAQASIDFSNEQAAFNAALRASATIVQSSLLDFLH